jgi:DNA (cytosine-5)-methyltransferase 1
LNDSREIKLKRGGLDQHYISLAGILDLFPKDAIGASAKKGGRGVDLILEIVGLEGEVRTDLPSHPTSGKPRPIFRDRKWVGQFMRKHRLKIGDTVRITRLASHRFRIEPGSSSGFLESLPFVEPAVRESRARSRPFTFIDLFAGIGGLRLGVERAGGRCIWSSEWDSKAQETYEAWFGERPHGDITKVDAESIPDHDLLCGGFPCQPFSIAGVSKKNSLGRAHGFKDAAQGTLFFDVARIIEAKRPKALLLENVKNLKSHDKGNTWRVIEGTLADLGYQIFAQVINAKHWVPQNRERVFIVGFDKSVFGVVHDFRFPELPSGPLPKFRSILEASVPTKYTLTDHLWAYLQRYAAKHRAAGNGFGFGLTDLDGIARTLSARYYKDGSEILIPQANKNPRRLMPSEARRLMGFPDSLPIVVADTPAYKQFGNAVVPLVAEAVAKQLAIVLGRGTKRRSPAKHKANR